MAFSEILPKIARNSAGQPPLRIGWLAPYAELPGEYADVLAGIGVPNVAWQVVTESEDTHDVEGLRALAAIDRLTDGAARLRRWHADVAIWACTSGSFIAGREFAEAQSEAIAKAAGCLASSTSLAFIAALRHLGIDRVSMVASYPEPATRRFVEFLAEFRIKALSVASFGAAGARAAERLDARAVAAKLRQLGQETGDAILLPDTAVWGISLQAELAGRFPAMMLSANQVTIWEAFRLLGKPVDLGDIVSTLRFVSRDWA
ncbi:MAG: hypothetical protein JO273_14495 [Methylobacteriaceae bacterium]|nr:hypothetical protein [Methylobacteriaceae bacterium]